jgi:hypothetical protein
MIAWQTYDDNANGMIQCYKAKDFIMDLKPPLGLPKEYKNSVISSHLLKKIKIPVYKDLKTNINHYYFYDLALGLTKASLQNSKKYKNIDDQKVQLHKMVRMYRNEKLRKYKVFKRLDFSSAQVEAFEKIRIKLSEKAKTIPKAKLLKKKKIFALTKIQEKLIFFQKNLDFDREIEAIGSDEERSGRSEEGLSSVSGDLKGNKAGRGYRVNKVFEVPQHWDGMEVAGKSGLGGGKPIKKGNTFRFGDIVKRSGSQGGQRGKEILGQEKKNPEEIKVLREQRQARKRKDRFGETNDGQDLPIVSRDQSPEREKPTKGASRDNSRRIQSKEHARQVRLESKEKNRLERHRI